VDCLDYSDASSIKSPRFKKDKENRPLLAQRRQMYHQPLKTSALDMMTPTTIGASNRSGVPASAGLKHSWLREQDGVSHELRAYINQGFEISEQFKEQHKIYAPKAFNFLVKESRKRKKRYISSSFDLNATQKSTGSS
jgi:hypothetical protein